LNLVKGYRNNYTPVECELVKIIDYSQDYNYNDYNTIVPNILYLTGSTASNNGNNSNNIASTSNNSIDLSNYYTITQLQTSCSSIINWYNINNVPNNILNNNSSGATVYNFTQGIQNLSGNTYNLGGEFENISLYANNTDITPSPGFTIQINTNDEYSSMSGFQMNYNDLVFTATDNNGYSQAYFNGQGFVYTQDLSARNTGVNNNPLWIPSKSYVDKNYIYSPNGSLYQIVCSNSGVLSTVLISGGTG
jgi:hypothetical protein